MKNGGVENLQKYQILAMRSKILQLGFMINKQSKNCPVIIFQEWVFELTRLEMLALANNRAFNYS